jgi:hypothetical protein
MKWESIKLQVIQYMVPRLRAGIDIKQVTAILAHSLSHNVDFRTASKEVEDAAVKVVDNWDIRGAERLRDIFPEAFPKSLREGKLKAYMRDSDAEWVIEKAIL